MAITTVLPCSAVPSYRVRNLIFGGWEGDYWEFIYTMLHKTSLAPGQFWSHSDRDTSLAFSCSQPPISLKMEEQKHKLLDNDYQNLGYETDDSVSGVGATGLSQASGDQLRIKRLGRTILCVITGVLFAAIFYLLGNYTSVTGSDPYLAKAFGSGHCGNTSEEATKNGCIVDLIPGAWVHPDCYDKDLEREFLEYGDWHWYADPKGKEEVSEEYMRRTGGPNPVYVSLAYHDTHCAFTWRKLHRAVLRGTPIDSHIGEYEHTEHCSGALAISRDAEKFPEWKAPARFFNLFTSCELPQKCKWNPSSVDLYHVLTEPKIVHRHWEMHHGSKNGTY